MDKEKPIVVGAGVSWNTRRGEPATGRGKQRPYKVISILFYYVKLNK